jgi:hypothetical protein
MFCTTEIRVLDVNGQAIAVALPVSLETCWLCHGDGRNDARKNSNRDHRCVICDGDGQVLMVQWDQIDPRIRGMVDQAWHDCPHA